MTFWIFMLLMEMLLPVCMIGFGSFLKKGGPSQINHLFGYRTRLSMKSRESWEFAQRRCGEIWFPLGLISLLFSLLWMLTLLGKSTDAVGTWGGILTVIQLLLLVGSIFPVERALRKNFDENGKRR